MQSPIDPENVETGVIHDLVDFTNTSVLEIGCGDGRLTWRYADRAKTVLAVDPDEQAITRARASQPHDSQAAVSFQVADITTMTLPPGLFDVAVFSWSL